MSTSQSASVSVAGSNMFLMSTQKLGFPTGGKPPPCIAAAAAAWGAIIIGGGSGAAAAAWGPPPAPGLVIHAGKLDCPRPMPPPMAAATEGGACCPNEFIMGAWGMPGSPLPAADELSFAMRETLPIASMGAPAISSNLQSSGLAPPGPAAGAPPEYAAAALFGSCAKLTRSTRPINSKPSISILSTQLAASVSLENLTKANPLEAPVDSSRWTFAESMGPKAANTVLRSSSPICGGRFPT
mmetsp:Transcript_75775/g.152252  ORF Transcript_75775/g.152252 Transcript_75775/m.152252 type:complete len:241 (+) Transcript_75775:333-1055(+)